MVYIQINQDLQISCSVGGTDSSALNASTVQRFKWQVHLAGKFLGKWSLAIFSPQLFLTRPKQRNQTYEMPLLFWGSREYKMNRISILILYGG